MRSKNVLKDISMERLCIDDCIESLKQLREEYDWTNTRRGVFKVYAVS